MLPFEYCAFLVLVYANSETQMTSLMCALCVSGFGVVAGDEVAV